MLYRRQVSGGLNKSNCAKEAQPLVDCFSTSAWVVTRCVTPGSITLANDPPLLVINFSSLTIGGSGQLLKETRTRLKNLGDSPCGNRPQR